MPHTCRVCLVTCEDFRVHRGADGPSAVAQAAAAIGGDFDLITRAGGIQDLVRGPAEYGQLLLRDIGVAVQRHGVQTVCLMNHADCGAYGPLGGPEEEFSRHQADLRHAAQIVREHFPGVRVVQLFAVLRPGSHDAFEPRVLDDDAKSSS